VANIAQSVVRECLRLKEDEPVIISTYPHTMEMANQLSLECYKVGADPLIQLETDEWFYGQFKHLTIEQLRKTSKHCLGLNDYVTAYISLGGPKNPAPMKTVPKDKFAAMFQGEQAHYEAALQKKMSRSVYLGLGQVTPERAKTYGFSYAVWKKNMNDALSVKYASLQQQGKYLASYLSGTGDVRITAPNGTDLSFRLDSRPVHVYDGIIDDEDLAKDNRSASLPSGDITTTVDESSAEGRIVFDIPTPQVGLLIQGMSWTFKGGHLVDFAAKKNVDATKSFWDRASGGKDLLSSLSIGINPKAKASFLQPYIALGAVSVGIGENREYGGKVQSDYMFGGTVSNATLEVAGKRVVDRGKIVV